MATFAEIEDKTALVLFPQAESQLVQIAKKEIFQNGTELLDFESLTNGLGTLGKIMRVAYNGVAGDAEMQIKVQSIGYTIADLTSKSATTLSQFKNASKRVLEAMKSTHDYLMDGLEENAVVTLSMIMKKAEEMADAAGELSKEFEEAKKNLIETKNELHRAEGRQRTELETYEDEIKQFQSKKAESDMLVQSTCEAFDQACKLYNAAREREDEAQRRHDSKLNALANTFIDFLGAVPVTIFGFITLKFEQAAQKLLKIGDKSGYKEAITRANEEKMRLQNLMEKEKQNKQRVLSECINLTQKLQDCNDKSKIKKAAIDALHSSVGALGSLAGTMRRASEFWKFMHQHCKDLMEKQGEIKELIRANMDKASQERLKVWKNPTFNENAQQCYNEWLALNEACGENKVKINETLGDLYSYLEENPTPEESMKNIHRLAAELNVDLKKQRSTLNFTTLSIK